MFAGHEYGQIIVREGLCCFMVCHDMEVVLDFATRIVVGAWQRVR